MEPSPTLDDAVQRWQALRQQGRTAAVDDLCGDRPEDAATLSAKLQAVASMVAFLGIEPGPDPEPTTDGVNRPDAEQPPAGPARLPDLPGYTLLDELGRGGMGVVYRARQLSLDRVVALKRILTREHATPEQLARFRNEARAVAQLRHPHIVQVHEIGEHAGLPFITFEYIHGGSLDRRLTGAPLPAATAARLVDLLARAVHAAHEHGIVHRDLKPGNILLDDQGAGIAGWGVPKVTDFGLAKLQDADSNLTVTGSVMGSPSYMAPEQAEGKFRDVGPPADIYALGAILYELLTGRPPFRGVTVLQTLEQVKTADPAPPSRLVPGLDRDIETITLKCLEKEPAKRYTTAAALAEDLARFQAGRPILARPVAWPERAERWCRRNPALAGAVAAVAASIVAAIVVSLQFALRADAARAAAAERARDEKSARQDAQRARRDAQRQLVDLSASSGLTAARDGDHALALLWSARAVELAQDDPERDALNRTRYANWLRHVWLPEGTFAIPGFRRGLDRFRVLQCSPDGRFVLAIATVGPARVWDRTRSRFVPLPDPADGWTAGAWEPRDGLLALASRDGRVRLLQPPTFETVEEFSAEGEPTVLEFSPDGRLLAWGGPRSARVWDRDTRAYATPALPHDRPVATLAFRADGRLLATSALDAQARVFRVDSHSPDPLFPPAPHALGSYNVNHGGPERLAPRFCAGGTFLTADRRDGRVNLVWRSDTTGAVVATTEAPFAHESLSAFDVSPAGDRVVAAWAGVIRLLEVPTRAVLAAVPFADNRWCEDVRFTADGRSFVTCDQDMKADFWSVDDTYKLNLGPASPFILHPMQAVRVGLARDARHIAVGLWDGTVCLWHAPAGPPRAYEIAVGGGTRAELSPDRRLVAPRGTSFRNGTMRETQVFDARTGRPAGPKLAPGGIIVDVKFSPDGNRLALGVVTARTPEERAERMFLPDGRAGNVQIWDWRSGARIIDPIPLPAEPRGLAFRPDGGSLAVICADYLGVIVNPATGAVLHQLDPGIRTRPDPPNFWTTNGAALFSPDSRFLLTWSRVPQLHVWDPDSGRMLHTLEHTGRVEDAVYNPADPSVLATGGRDSVVRVWDLRTGQALAKLPHPRWIHHLAFSPDGSELVSGCSDGMVRSWDWRNGTLTRGLAHNPALEAFDFTERERRLVVAGIFSLQVTDWRSGTPLGPEWSVRDSIHWGVSVTAGDARAIVGGGGLLIGFDLGTMITPSAEPIEDMVRRAEIAAGRRILDEGEVVPITSTEWSNRWRQLSSAESPPTTPADSVDPVPVPPGAR